MPLERITIWGSPNIGVFALATEKFAIVPAGTSPRKIELVENTLKVPVMALDVGESKLVGVLASANSNGILLPHFASDSEVSLLREKLGTRIERLESKRTALGNLILANDRGGVVDPGFEAPERKIVSDVLDVEIATGKLAGLPYVGSFGTATSAVALVHPLTEDNEKQVVSDLLKVAVELGTVNAGVPYVASGLLSNRHGTLVGTSTTGPELLIISNAFGL